MTEYPAASDNLQPLLAAMLDGQLADEQIIELRRLLTANPLARRQYVRQVATHGMLQWAVGGSQDSGFRVQGSGFRDQWTEETVDTVGAAIQLPHRHVAPGSPVPFPSLSTTGYPLSTTDFIGSWLCSYMAATVIVGAILLGAWAYKITHYQQIAETPSPSVSSSDRTALVFVGRITGMVDCRWADPQTEAYGGASVPLGRKYALASGLMEITYTTGAKVILQGPCTYEVESRAGGYLSLGKLTAKVASGQWPVASAKPQAANPKSSALRPPPSAFVVRTPTAIVTDLGTEFGVEVSREGNTTSHVFRGSVKVAVLASKKGTGPICRNGPKGASHKLDLSPFSTEVILRENESARVEPGSDRIVAIRQDAAMRGAFARQIPRRKPIKLFNTGVGLKEGDADPHWQLVARSDDPNFQPRPAVVTANHPYWLANDPARSQWISTGNGPPDLPDGVTYTFRTTFELSDVLPEGTVLRGRFIVDNHVNAVRLNGKELPVPEHAYESFEDYSEFRSNKGFMEGTNVLEIEVFNGRQHVVSGESTGMGLLAELQGSAIQGWKAPSAVSDAGRAAKTNNQ